jgi:antitoxin ParD1/3/4
MAEGINVRFSGELKRFIDEKTSERGLYGSVSEYIRDLVRHDYEKEEQRRWDLLYDELRPGLEAADEDFVALDLPALLKEARERAAANR